ncbi:MAG: TetR/AcrR family transcriptional regulator [Litorilinea sp.]
MSPRARRQQRTSQAILDAARQIIQREGIDALSMRALAERIDYSPASLYEYYGSKDEIIQAVCEQGHGLMRDRMAQVDKTLDVVDYLVQIGLVYIHFAVTNPDYFRIMFAVLDGNMPDPGAADGPEANTEANTEASTEASKEARPLLAPPPPDSSFYILLGAIQRGIDEGVYRVQPEIGLLEMAYGAWSLVHGLATLRIAHDSRFPVDYTQTEPAILRAYAAGLGQKDK